MKQRKPNAEGPAAKVTDAKRDTAALRSRLMADVMTDGLAGNAFAAMAFSKSAMPELTITDMVDSLRKQGERVNADDFSQQEQMLNAQANALNGIFSELCRRAAMNMGEYIGAMDTYLRLALKAQSQCRATVETLATIKNPPVVYAKQANIAHGPQQVNIGGNPARSAQARTHAHEEERLNPQNKLLEDARDGRTYLDTRATPATARGNPEVATVGKVNRAKKPRG